MKKKKPKTARLAPMAGQAQRRETDTVAASPPSLAAPELRALLAAARQARRHAHAPYSRFQVGAAILDERGRIHTGCNVENASYGPTVCAERHAVAAAINAGARRVRAVCVVADADPPATPCGACRQVLAEFAADGVPVLLARPTGPIVRRLPLGALLPDAFRL